jgi:phosphoribosylglycinamide formyltransferase 1
MTLSLGVLISGGGTNLQALLDATSAGELDAQIRVVISNQADAYGLERARARGIPTVALSHRAFADRAAFDEALVKALREHGVEWVALAGFMRVLTPGFLAAFPDRVVNIHPALLPAFPGVEGIRQAHDYGVKIAGCTVHFVDTGVDSGPIIAQRAVSVLESDTAESLKQRVLTEEHLAFVLAWKLIAAGRVRIETNESGRRIAKVLPPPGAENAP